MLSSRFKAAADIWRRPDHNSRFWRKEDHRVGRVLTDDEKKDLREVFEDLQERDVEVVLERGFWRLPFSSEQATLSPEQAARLICREKKNFRSRIFLVRGQERVPVRHLGELRNASAYLAGPEHYDRAQQPQLLKALTNLNSKLWVVKGKSSEGDEVLTELKPLEAYQRLQQQAPVEICSPEGQTYKAKDWFELGAIDYLLASRDPETLKREELAEPISAVLEDGFEFRTNKHDQPWLALSYAQKSWNMTYEPIAGLYLDRLRIARLEEMSAEDLEQAHQRGRAVREGLEAHLYPAMKAGLLKEDLQTYYLEFINNPHRDPRKASEFAVDFLKAVKVPVAEAKNLHRYLRETFPEDELLGTVSSVERLVELGGLRLAERVVLALQKDSQPEEPSESRVERLKSLAEKESWLLGQPQVQALPHWHLRKLLAAAEGKTVDAQRSILLEFSQTFLQSGDFSQSPEALNRPGRATEIRMTEDGLQLGDYFLPVND